jgi:hypothetical protein
MHVFCMVLTVNNINKLIFVMEKCDVLFEVRNKSLNIIYTNFGFEGLTSYIFYKYLRFLYTDFNNFNYFKTFIIF